MTDTARELVVHGLVQGVFFRDSTRREAAALGLAGWVRNEYDGTVRIHVEGDADAVGELVAWAQHGPRHAAVDRVDVTDVRPQGHRGFEVR
ncbi:MAG: acylphosphatase [Nocardioides sp.]